MEKIDGIAYECHQFNRHWPLETGWSRPEPVVKGAKWALEQGYEFVFELDGDFSHNPDDIPMFLQAAQRADLVLGSRYINGIRITNWPLSRLLLSMGGAMYVQTITGMPFTDPTGGFKCFHRRVLESINLDMIRSNGYSFQIEMTHTAWMKGFRIGEIPITFEDRRAGYSKMNSRIVREALLMVWRLYLRNGLRRSPRHKTPPGGNPPLP
jgi:dolichol-phosphate mannosyltransferase